MKSGIVLKWQSDAARCAGTPSHIADNNLVEENENLNPLPVKSQKTSLFASYGRRPHEERSRGSTPFFSENAPYLAMIHNTADIGPL